MTRTRVSCIGAAAFSGGPSRSVGFYPFFTAEFLIDERFSFFISKVCILLVAIEERTGCP